MEPALPVRRSPFDSIALRRRSRSRRPAAGLLALVAACLLTSCGAGARVASDPAPAVADAVVAQEGGATAAEAPSVSVGVGTVQVVLVRHAEKRTDQGSDPELTQAGQDRAERLAALFRAAGADAFFASQYRRTQDTLAPWANAQEVEVAVHDAGDPAGLVERLRALEPGALAAVAGHSNTIPDLARRLGAPLGGLDARGFLPEATYDRLFVVTVPVGAEVPADAPATLLELSF